MPSLVYQTNGYNDKRTFTGMVKNTILGNVAQYKVVNDKTFTVHYVP